MKLFVIESHQSKSVEWFLYDTDSVMKELSDGLVDLIKNTTKIFLFLVYSGALVSTFHSI